MRHNYPLTLEGGPCRLGVMDISRSGCKQPAQLLSMWGGPEGAREGFHFQITSSTRTERNLRKLMLRLPLIYFL